MLPRELSRSSAARVPAPAPGREARGRSTLSARPTPPSGQQYRAAAVLRSSLRRFSRASEEILRAHGLTNERYELLLAIKDLQAGGAEATVTSLTAELDVAQVSMTQLVRRAEEAGLLARDVSPEDARVRFLKLTPAGEVRLAAAVADLAGERSRLAAVLAEL